MPDVLILGAGVAGLACAGALAQAGARVTVLDKGRGVGGRVATRRVDGQPVDHGVAFFHGSDRAFLQALEATPATRLDGWPARVRGAGLPCNPAAWDRAARRLAYAEGASAFPKALAAGLDVRTGVRVSGLSPRDGGLDLTDDAGQTWHAPTLILALPLEQARALLAPVVAFTPATALLGAVETRPCWTVIARYDGLDDPLDAELYLPEDSPVLQVISHDSSKRPPPRQRVLVLQARAAWSQAHLEAPEAEVSAALLAEAARVLGPWAGAPAGIQAHRWRYARVQGGDSFGAPYLQTLPSGARLGLIGETFDRAGGVEGAFRAGRRLARHLSGAPHA